MAGTILETIIARKREEIAAAKKRQSLRDLEDRFSEVESPRGFAGAMADRVAGRRVAVIAEIKKASPSKGTIRENFSPAEHAADYASHGATCLSVLTDRDFFQGSFEHLREARGVCDLPVLRKDFMIEPYQIAETRALGADCILLIVAALQPTQMQELAACAQEIGLDVLVEIHNARELEQAMDVDTSLIGINNRDLHSFATSLNTTLNLLPEIPAGKTIITESGINSATDVETMIDNGVFGFLVGESLMGADSPGSKLQELFAAYD